jgi:hypothetical protein
MQTSELAPTIDSSRPMRNTLTVCLTILTCVVVVLATLALGVQQTLLNTDRWVSVVGPLATNPQVQTSIADTASAMTVNAVQDVTQSLPAPVRGLAAPIGNALSSFVDEQALQIAQSPQFAEAWTNANRVIHQSLVQLLRGEPSANGAVTVNNGQVEVNMLMLLPSLTDRVQQQIPSVVMSQLPSDFGYLSVAQVSTLATLQRAVQSLDSITLALVVAVPVLIVGTLAASENRRRTIVWLGAGVALGMLIAAGSLVLAQAAVVGQFSGQPISGAVQAAMGAMFLSLGIGLLVVFVVAVVVALAAGFSGRRPALAN